MSSRPSILVAATGGTIAAAPSVGGLNEVAQSASELLAAVPEAVGAARLEPVDVCSVASHSITPEHMCELAHLIAKTLCAGVVVTHGTDTIEETAYALSLMLERRIPVVLTGAMRSPDQPGADGSANLLAAIRVALSPCVAALGPVVVVQDEIHLARQVSKVHTSRVAAFASPGLGPVGTAAEGRVRLAVNAVPDERLGLPDRLDRQVDLVWTAAGIDGRLLDAAIEADGIVVAGTGGGHLPDRMIPALERVLAARRPVVLASRTGSGATLAGSYGGPGSESELQAMGVLSAGAISPVKARLRLMVALQLGLDANQVFPA